LRIGVVGLGKMGLSHLAIARAHPDVVIGGVCDSAAYVRDTLKRHAGLPSFADYDRMLDEAILDAVIIATPSRSHASLTRKALEHGVHVFCEKPFVLDPREGSELVKLATKHNLANQIGYHNRFVASFREVKRLLDAGAIGEPTHILAEAYGPVVLREAVKSWRSERSEGGGCLYDYAAHPLNLINWYFGVPEGVGGTKLNSVFSKGIEDEVYATLFFGGDRTAQLAVNWSDESARKMTTKISIWGTEGRIYADRQEIQVYLRSGAELVPGYRPGWNVKYTTELTAPVWFYLRGEEYSAQLDNFVTATKAPAMPNENSFEAALETDLVIEMLLEDAAQPHGASTQGRSAPRARVGRNWFGLPS
jgi:predicted dehydrogenase